MVVDPLAGLGSGLREGGAAVRGTAAALRGTEAATNGAKAVADAGRAAVAQAWRDEQARVKATGSGTTDWLPGEIVELLESGRVKGYQGHHVNSVKWSLDNVGDPMWYIRNPNNVEFLNRADHLDAHGGNWRNYSTGELLDRGF
jgi:hypothetical protein